MADAATLGGWDVTGFLDQDASKRSHAGRSVFGPLERLSDLLAADPQMQIVIAIGDNATRQRVVHDVRALVQKSVFATVVHPRAVLAGDVQLGAGTVVFAGAVLNPGVEVGDHCIVNTGARVDHDCALLNFSSVAPGATLGGDVELGVGAVVSLGASVIHGVRVGDHAVVGAGAVVLESVPPRTVSYGVPARVIRPRREDEPYLPGRGGG